MTSDAELQQPVIEQPAEPLDEAHAEVAREFIATIETLAARNLYDEVDTLARQMVQILPGDGFGWKTLAYGYLRRGDLAGALEPLRRAAALLPADAELGTHLHAATAMHEALALDQLGRHADAGKQYQTVLATYPGHPEANHRLGVVAIRLGQPAAALPYFEKALGAHPGNAQWWTDYIQALMQCGQLKAARAALEMGRQHGMNGPAVDDLMTQMNALSAQGNTPAQRTEHGSVEQKPSRGQQNTPNAPHSQQDFDTVIALFNSGRLAEAEASARVLVERVPAQPLGWKMLGISLYRLGRYDEALDHLHTAHGLSPQDVDVLQVLAALLEARGQHGEAERACRQLLKLAPKHAEGLRIMGIILMSLGRFEEAQRFCERAVEAAPGTALAPNTLGLLHMKQGHLAEAAELFRRSLEFGPGGELTWSNLLLCLTHSENTSPAHLFAEHCRFGTQFETALKPHWPQHANPKQPDRPLRIGFISGDFRRHAVASFLEPVLPHLARDPGLSLYAYSNTPGADEVTVRLRSDFTGWHDIYGTSDDEVARLIRADGIDILIDLAGHTANNRLLVMARKPAPIQAEWIGYPGTTGLTAVDYFLADRYWVPSDAFRNQLTEQVVWLPAVAPFLPESSAPPVNPLPALRNGYLTFGSFNRINKLRRDVIALWSQLLRVLPTSRMLIGAMPGDGAGADRLIEWFAEEGVARERLEFHPRASVSVFLQQHHHVDVCLDTFPFGGLTTALQSLWMGVPTLTLPGHTVPGRSGATAMGHAGLEAFVATDADDFVRKGVARAADLPALATLRAGMRERCMASPMFRSEAIAAGVVEALRIMWRRWCEGLPARAFDVSGEVAQAAAPAHRS
ncbi:MAG TPA: tetratricopeptide repeat protein [Paraburkholderia sp.]|nr:tetratricopeptide repeat protein [Paraburkholderia sp.]